MIKPDHFRAYLTKSVVKCDFCYVPVSAGDSWTYFTDGFVLPKEGLMVDDFRDDGFWATCWACYKLIRADDLEGLIKYSTEADLRNRDLVPGLTEEEILWWISKVQRAFWEHRLPVLPIYGFPMWEAESQLSASRA